MARKERIKLNREDNDFTAIEADFEAAIDRLMDANARVNELLESIEGQDALPNHGGGADYAQFDDAGEAFADEPASADSTQNAAGAGEAQARPPSNAPPEAQS